MDDLPQLDDSKIPPEQLIPPAGYYHEALEDLATVYEGGVEYGPGFSD